MSTSEIAGILVALPTPYTADQRALDLQALDAHIQRLIKIGVHGLVPGGSTGEFTVLSTAERKQLVEQCVKSAAGRVPVVAGVGDLSSERTVELAKHAAEAGAASIMVVPPFYDSLTLDQLCTYLSEVHAACGLPICYYNIPSLTGTKLSAAELATLGQHGVKYMKDTSGDGPALTELLFAHQDKITTFNGWDTLTFYGLAAGAKGSVWGATNIIPELSIELWEALAVQKDLERGRRLWQKIWPVCSFLEEGNYAASIKTGMELRGWATGGIRKPFGLLNAEQKARLAKLLKEAGVEVSP